MRWVAVRAGLLQGSAVRRIVTAWRAQGRIPDSGAVQDEFSRQGSIRDGASLSKGVITILRKDTRP